MAAPSASRPRRRPSGSDAARIRSACPPPPTVASMWRLPGRAASIATTSSGMTGTCWVATVAGSVGAIASDPEAGDRVGEGLRVGHRPAVVGPAVRCPDLGVVTDPHDHRLGGEPGLLAEIARQQKAALLVELGLERTTEDLALEQAGPGVGDGQAGHGG